MTRVWCLAAAIVLFLGVAAKAEELTFLQLPKEVRDLAIEVRNRCREQVPESKFDDLQGIQVVHFSGDSARDIIVDNETLCNSPLPAANCSNRGCDMTIYKEISKGHWRKIFDEHLHAKFVALDWDTMRFQLMIASISAADPRCQPDPRKNYTSGQSCNLIATYRNNRWNWRKIQ
jgi:hypothetical protein